MKKFKNNFLFGASTCAFQIEGGRNLGGRKDSIWDKFTKDNFFIPEIGDPSREINSIDEAADFYNMYEVDIKIMKKIGLNCLVYNMDWTRIFPESQDDINEEGLNWYENLFNLLVKNGIKPVPILYHWDTPMWLESLGGASSRAFLPAFKKYCSVVFERLGKYTDTWYVNDENSTFSTGAYLDDYLPPQKNDEKEFWKSVHILTLSGAVAKKEFEVAKKKGFLENNSVIGIDHDWNPPIPYNPNDKKDLEAVKIFNSYNLDLFLDPNMLGKYPDIFFENIKKWKLNNFVNSDDLSLINEYKLDFIGWNYYRPAFITHKNNLKSNMKWKKTPDFFINNSAQIVYPLSENYTDWNWLVKPSELSNGALYLWKRYKKPLMIVENGIGYFDKKDNGIVDDYYRIFFLNSHLREVQKAVEKGIPFIGYSLWTYNDIYSPSGGYRKKYGLVGVDYEGGSLERFPKSSMAWYRDAIKNKSSHAEPLQYDKFKKEAILMKKHM